MVCASHACRKILCCASGKDPWSNGYGLNMGKGVCCFGESSCGEQPEQPQPQPRFCPDLNAFHRRRPRKKTASATATATKNCCIIISSQALQTFLKNGWVMDNDGKEGCLCKKDAHRKADIQPKGHGQGPLKAFADEGKRAVQTGATIILAAVGASRLIVPPLTLTMHCCPFPLQSNSSSQPGKRPRLAILAQVRRSPLTEQTRKCLWQQVCESGVLDRPAARWPHFLRRRHREKKSARKKQEFPDGSLVLNTTNAYSVWVKHCRSLSFVNRLANDASWSKHSFRKSCCMRLYENVCVHLVCGGKKSGTANSPRQNSHC